MRVLFDHNVDRRFRRFVPGHEIKTTREMRWEQLQNGALLRMAADAGFDAFVSIDKKLEHEQNLKLLPLPVVVIDSRSNALPALVPFALTLLDVLSTPFGWALVIIMSGGRRPPVDRAAQVKLTLPWPHRPRGRSRA